MQEFNKLFETKIQKLNNKFLEAKEKMSKLDDNILIEISFSNSLNPEFLAKLFVAKELYLSEIKKSKRILIVAPNFNEYDVISYFYSNNIPTKNIFLINTTNLTRHSYIEQVSKIIYGINETTYKTVLEVSNPEKMYINHLIAIEYGFAPLNFSAPVEGKNINIFDEFANVLIPYITNIEDWLAKNYPKDYDFWNNQYKIASEATKTAKQKFKNKVLIECAAQHPLKDGYLPAEEFEKRLNKAFELYMEEILQGNEPKIYIPGSIHQIQTVKGEQVINVPDKISLSLCGKNYLLSLGVPEKDIYSEETNNEILPCGVYNSADECFVASEIFKRYKFGELKVVASAGQLYRVALFYSAFGVIPQYYTAPTEKSFHNIIEEITTALPMVITKAHTWQLNSDNIFDREIAIKSRAERNPFYNENDFKN